MPLAAIEKVWSVAKAYFNKQLLQIKEEVSVDRFRLLVLHSFAQIPPHKITNLILANGKYIRDVLKADVARNQ